MTTITPVQKPAILKTVVIMLSGRQAKGKLIPIGKQQSAATAAWLKEMLGDEQILVLTSPTPHAAQTADIVAKQLKAPAVPKTALAGKDGDWDEFDKMMERLHGRKDTKAIVIVTHATLVTALMKRYGAHCLPPNLKVVVTNLVSGEALILGGDGSLRQSQSEINAK